MMKRMLFALSLLCATSAVAAPPTKESIDTLLDETKIARSLDAMMDNTTRTMQQQTASLFAGGTMTPDRERAMRETQAKTADILRQELTFARLEPIYVDVYQQTFTQEEIDNLIAFYRTPAGRAYTDKLPEVLQRTLVAMQPLMKETMQKIQAMVKQAAEDAKAATPPPASPTK